jgi:hypothetical protein
MLISNAAAAAVAQTAAAIAAAVVATAARAAADDCSRVHTHHVHRLLQKQLQEQFQKQL